MLGHRDDREVVSRPPNVAPATLEIRLAVATALPGGIDAPDPQGQMLHLSPDVAVTGSDIKTVAIAMSGNADYAVEVDVSTAAGDRLRKLTQANIGSRLAILVDHKVVSAPTIRDAAGGRFQIVGGFTRASARELAERIAP